MTVARSHRTTVAFVAVAITALCVALRAPLLTTVLGLVTFGVLHNALELRYVTGRFRGILRGPLLATLALLITGIVICRLLGARTPEILLGYAILGTGVVWAPRPAWQRIAGCAVLAVALAASLTFPAYHFVVLAHLHNMVPLVFLWEWARRLPAPARRWFRVTQVGWVLAVPAVVFSGALDRFIAAGGSAVVAFAGTSGSVASAFTPPDASVIIGERFLVVFAFLQTMHYVVWVAFLPRCAPDAARAFDARVPWLRGRRLWLLAAGIGGLLAILFVADYLQGRVLYSSFASYHAYLEFPVVLALLLGTAPQDAGPSTISPSAAPPILLTTAAVRFQEAS